VVDRRLQDQKFVRVLFHVPAALPRLTHTHGLSGMNLTMAIGANPPQGIAEMFGTVHWQVMPVLCRIHCPHI